MRPTSQGSRGSACGFGPPVRGRACLPHAGDLVIEHNRERARGTTWSNAAVGPNRLDSSVMLGTSDSRLRILYCDDNPQLLETFRTRHRARFDIETLVGLDYLWERLAELARGHNLPDLLLLDLYHPYESPSSNAKRKAAEERLGELTVEINEVRAIVNDAYLPSAVDALEGIRHSPATEHLPVMIYSRRGLLFLEDEQIRTIEALGAEWLIKDPLRIHPPTEAERIRRFVQRVERGRSVFIGHGRSGEWKLLRDFVQEELRLPCEEFSHVESSGRWTLDRLSEMLKMAGFAFLLLTAEDERRDAEDDARLAARQNVVHELGLFQGRLGFKRAIPMIEKGCETFSNIHGLQHIPFDRGNIAAAFPRVREVLAREGLVRF